VDGDLAKKTDLAEAVRLDRHPLTTRRCDADGRVLDTGPPPQRRGARRQDDGNGHVHDLRRVAALGPMAAAAPLQLDTAVVGHGTRQRPLRLVVVVNQRAPAQPRDIVLASTDLALDGRKLVELSGARVPSEFLCRDRTPCTGRSDGQARAEAVRDVQVNAALATRTLARTEPL
jgi:hypothetical protein